MDLRTIFTVERQDRPEELRTRRLALRHVLQEAKRHQLRVDRHAPHARLRLEVGASEADPRHRIRQDLEWYPPAVGSSDRPVGVPRDCIVVLLRHYRPRHLPVTSYGSRTAAWSKYWGRHAREVCGITELLDVLKSAYITLDDYMLSDEDCAILTRFHELFQQPLSGLDRDELIKKLTQVDTEKARQIKARLMEGMNRRNETIDKLFNERT